MWRSLHRDHFTQHYAASRSRSFLPVAGPWPCSPGRVCIRGAKLARAPGGAVVHARSRTAWRRFRRAFSGRKAHHLAHPGAAGGRASDRCRGGSSCSCCACPPYSGPIAVGRPFPAFELSGPTAHHLPTATWPEVRIMCSSSSAAGGDRLHDRAGSARTTARRLCQAKDARARRLDWKHRGCPEDPG